MSKTKERVFVINLDHCKSIRTHWLAIYFNCDNIAYFDGFEVENIPKENKSLISIKNMRTNI